MAAPPQRRVLLTLFILGFACTITQLVLLREMLSAFSGNEMVLGVVLGLWLLLMGLGAWLGRPLGRLRNPLSVLAGLLLLIAVLPPLQVFLLRALRDVVFIRGAAVGVEATTAAVFVLLLPYCLAAGSALALACSTLALEEGASGVGRGYVADSAGSIAGGALFSFVLVHFLDHIALLICLALPCLCAVAHLSWPRRSPEVLASGSGPFRKWGLVLLAVATVVATTVALLTSPALGLLDNVSTRLQFPQQLVTRANSPYGRLVLTQTLTDTTNQVDLFQNNVPLVSAHDVQRAEETVHYAMAQRPEARNVLIIGGGMSGTPSEILKYPVLRVDYVELDPSVLDLTRDYLPSSRDEPRFHVFNTDGRSFIHHPPHNYHVILIDLPEPSTAQLNRFYTVEFFAEARQALGTNGVLSFSLPGYENYVSRDLARLLASTYRSLRESIPNVLVLPGNRVFFLASADPLTLDIASRLEQHRIRTARVKRLYMQIMFAPDRLADMARAIAEPAALNRDFSPVLYFYHLRHWLSQFNSRFGPLQWLLALTLVVYLVRLRAGRFVIFTSGFTASALEIVLLFGFQVLCGSVYHQVGVIVTLFMVGLALGAWVGNNIANRPPAASDGDLRLTDVLLGDKAPQQLSRLSALLAIYAVMLGWVLPSLKSAGDIEFPFSFPKVVIGLLILVLAGVVGMQFPFANRLEPQATAAVSRLYTADFVGAALGALLACALLLPLLGVMGVCLLVAVMNALAAWGARSSLVA